MVWAAPRGHRHASSITSGSSRSAAAAAAQRNLLGRLVDELLALRVIPARRQPQMPIQHLSHPPYREQILVHLAN
ncbi:hypothetical protein QRB37_23250, partial [Mycobacterium avium subsp. hominissuis]|uniref:hypothetical protein n=1 Tax=Mycobacterium avium TaxID=1764 RepID=UPI002664F541